MIFDITPTRPVLNMHNGKTNGQAHVYSDKQIHVDMDAIVSFIIQSCRRARRSPCPIMFIGHIIGL